MEWGRQVTDNRTLFEFLTLEGAQAGLAWITILRKRDGYRRDFHDFDFRRVAQMTSADEERLCQFDGIVKNRRKIHSTIVNAKNIIRLFCLWLTKIIPSLSVEKNKTALICLYSADNGGPVNLFNVAPECQSRYLTIYI